MMANYYWDANSWGVDYTPDNWEEIAGNANAMIDQFIATEHLDPKADVDQISDYSDRLWEKYCREEELFN